MVRAWWVVVVGMLWAGTARADAIPPPDDSLDCPDGSDNAVCHGGDYCRVETCSSDDDCDSGTCEEQSLCLGTIDCAGDDPNPTNTPNARACSDGCCETIRACTSGCGCQLVGARNPHGAWAALLLVAATTWRRRRSPA